MPTPEQITAAKRGHPDSLTAWKVLCEAHTEAESALRESEAKLEKAETEVQRLLTLIREVKL